MTEDIPPADANESRVDLEAEVRRVEFSVQIAQLEAYRAELITELERIEELITFYRGKLKELITHGTSTIGPDDDRIRSEAADAGQRRSRWGRIRDIDRP